MLSVVIFLDLRVPHLEGVDCVVELLLIPLLVSHLVLTAARSLFAWLTGVLLFDVDVLVAGGFVVNRKVQGLPVDVVDVLVVNNHWLRT